MQSTSQLQKRVENLNDQIKDIFHATQLNLEALAVQLQAYNQSKVTLSTFNHCQKQFQNIQQLFEERNSLRLEYLITEQIKEEQAKVRRERLVEYEEKIYDQRRLIADKEAFYEGLLRPRRKRPAHMTIEEFHAMRRQELIGQQRKNLKRLQEETFELKLMEKALKSENDQMQKLSKILEKQELSQEEIKMLENALEMNPVMYDSIHSLPSRKEDYNEMAKVYQNIVSIQQESQGLYKQYMQEKELYQYLKWEHKKLKAQYLEKQSEKKQREKDYQHQFDKITKYRFTRSFSV